MAEGVGTSTTAFLAHPSDVLALSTVKQGTGPNIAPLAPDPTQPARPPDPGPPGLPESLRHPRNGVGCGLQPHHHGAARGRQVESSRDAFFSSDQTAVRAVVRVAWALLRPASVVRIRRVTS